MLTYYRLFLLLSNSLNSQNVNTPAMEWQPSHQKTPFTTKKEIRWGNKK